MATVRTVAGVHTSTTDPEDTIWALLEYLATVKVVTSFKDLHNLWRMRQLAPRAVFVGRWIDVDIESGELHRLFADIAPDDYAAGYRLGAWYANKLGAMVIANHLEWMFWESGPNEHNVVTAKVIGYMAGFLDTFLALGLKGLIGGYSYGNPKAPPYDSVDEWAPWQPLFRKIDAANRAADGTPLLEPRFGLYVHEGGRREGLIAGIPHYVRRYKLMYDRLITPFHLWVPLVLSEFAYAADYLGAEHPSTAFMMQDISGAIDVLGQDRYLMGWEWYDYRYVSRDTFDDYRFMQGDLLGMFASKNMVFIPALPPNNEPTPEPEPIPTGPKITTANLYLRSGAGRAYTPFTIMPSGASVNVQSIQEGWAYVKLTINAWALCLPSTGYETWNKQSISLEGWCSSDYLM